MGSPLAAGQGGALIARRLLVATAALLLVARSGSAQTRPDSTPRGIRWPVLAVTVGAVAAATLLDPAITRDIHEHPSAGRLSTAKVLARFGTIDVIGPTVGVLAVAGLVSHDKALTSLALGTTKSILVATIAVEGIKLTTGRLRPHDDPDLGGDDLSPFSGNASFPSGHATAAFAFATTLGDAIHKPWARVGLYALATGTAWARVAQEEHWLSDVVAGAALGIASSKFATRRRTIFGVRAPRLGATAHSVALVWDGLPWDVRTR